MKIRKRNSILAATAEELRLIEKVTAKPVFGRLDKGELVIVSPDDWSDVPHLEEVATLRVPKGLYKKMAAVSRKHHTTPDRLAARWLAKHLQAA